MSESLLDALTNPRAIAIVGASDTETKLTARPMRFLRRHGYGGRIYPVNPARDTVLGEPAWPSVSALPERVDFAYILLDADPAIAVLRECATVGVRVVALLADGFAEAGEAGARRQAEIRHIAEAAGLLLIGPNSMGLVHTASGFTATTNAAFGAKKIKKGRLAVLSQSGSVIGTLLSRGAARGIGFSTMVSVGNEAGAGVGEIGQILVDDPATDGFLLFLETIRDRASLRCFAEKAHAAGKPLVAYMIGQTEEGQALSISHTGALTGSARAARALLRSLGIQCAERFDTLLEAPGALAKAHIGTERPRSATVIATTGGGGAMVVDQLAARGIEIAGISTASRTRFAERGIPSGHGKLVDVTLAGARYESMKEAISTLIRDPQTGLLVVAIGSSAQFDPELGVSPIVDAVAEAPEDAAPVLAFPLPHAPESMALLEAGGISSFGTVESCAETTAMLLHAPLIVANMETGPAPVLSDRLAALMSAFPDGALDETAASDLLCALGVERPKQLLLAPDASLPETLPFPYPIVAKLVSPDLPHKSEAGAVSLGITGTEDLTAAIARMRHAAEQFHPGFTLTGILLQETCLGLGEALIGLTRDPVAGPIITVAAGGILAEIYEDSAVRPAPVDIGAAMEMICEVKGFALLRGYRGRPEGDLDALARMIADLSRLALLPEILEVEINPVLVRSAGSGAVMLDTLVRLMDKNAIATHFRSCTG